MLKVRLARLSVLGSIRLMRREHLREDLVNAVDVTVTQLLAHR